MKLKFSYRLQKFFRRGKFAHEYFNMKILQITVVAKPERLNSE